MATTALQSCQNVTLPDIPELFNPNFLDILVPECATDTTNLSDNDQGPTNPFINALLEHNRKHTQNRAQAFRSTGSAILDAFSGLDDWSYHEVNEALESAWTEDPALTLRLIWNMRSIHDGKGHKEIFYRAFGWLYDHHPRTALTNLHWLITPACSAARKKDVKRPHGFWKDLLHILALATCNELSGLQNRSTFLHNYTPSKRKTSQYKTRTKEEMKDREDQFRARAKEKRKNLYQQFHDRFVRKLTTDLKYRALYITVTRLFAEQLRHDATLLEQLETVNKATDKEHYYHILRSISLVGKWAPTPGGSHDRVTNISTAICQLLFSPSENDGSIPLAPLPVAAPHPVPGDRENSVILRSYYARWVLRPLREILACPEPLMSFKRWNEIQYNRVPSVAMSNHKNRFIRYDIERFQLYLIDVLKKRKKISGATLMPHELVGEASRVNKDLQMNAKKNARFPKISEYKRNVAELEMQVIDAQWRTLVARMKESGNLDNCMAICDVSMGSTSRYNKRDPDPIFPALSLSLLVASLTKPPFNAGFITFSRNPQLFRLDHLEETSLGKIIETASRAHCGRHTNLRAVCLDLLLPLAQRNHIAKGDMVKRLFVFCDMQFEAAETEDEAQWETTYDLIEKAYKKAGYDVPEIVYWNLLERELWGGQTVEVMGDRKGVVMMSGFSPVMMKVLMGDAEEGEEEVAGIVEDEELTPMDIMKKALLKKSFDGLVVVD